MKQEKLVINIDLKEKHKLPIPQEDFLSAAFHDIGTSLCNLKMGIDNLELSCMGKFENDEKAILGVLKRNVERLVSLMKQLHFQSHESVMSL